MEIGFVIDDFTKEWILKNDLTKVFNRVFDELVLHHISIFRGVKEDAVLPSLLSASALTNATQIGIHTKKLVYAFKIESIVIAGMFTLKPSSAILPVAVNRHLQGKIKDVHDIELWFDIPKIPLTGRIEEIR